MKMSKSEEAFLLVFLFFCCCSGFEIRFIPLALIPIVVAVNANNTERLLELICITFPDFHGNGFPQTVRWCAFAAGTKAPERLEDSIRLKLRYHHRKLYFYPTFLQRRCLFSVLALVARRSGSLERRLPVEKIRRAILLKA